MIFLQGDFTNKISIVIILFLMGGVGLLADDTNKTNDVIQVLPGRRGQSTRKRSTVNFDLI